MAAETAPRIEDLSKAELLQLLKGQPFIRFRLRDLLWARYEASQSLADEGREAERQASHAWDDAVSALHQADYAANPRRWNELHKAKLDAADAWKRAFRRSRALEAKSDRHFKKWDATTAEELIGWAS